MDNIINSIKSLFSTYGFRAGAVIVLTVLIVNIIKKPIMNKAESVAKESGVDKSVITKYITALPVVVAFLLEFVISLFCSGFDFMGLAYGEIFASSVLYGGLAVATYESVKKQLEAYAADKNSAVSDRTVDTQKVKTACSVPVRFDENK